MNQPIHFSSTGSGQPVVFVHGLTCAGDDWSAQVAALKDRFQCVCVDMRGHGASAHLPGPHDLDTAAADLAELIKTQALLNPILVGHSWGTRVIGLTGAQLAGQIHGLVMVDGSQQADSDPDTARETIFKTINSHAGGVSGFITDMFGAMFIPDTPASVREPIIARAVGMDPDVFKSLIGDLIAFDAGRQEQTYSTLSLPVTIIQSTTIDIQDRVRRPLRPNETIPFTQMIQRAIAHANIQVVPGVGHFTQMDSPQSVIAAVEQLSN